MQEECTGSCITSMPPGVLLVSVPYQTGCAVSLLAGVSEELPFRQRGLGSETAATQLCCFYA